jgi:alpha-ketoglutaric semialdehyde dehydrogenase
MIQLTGNNIVGGNDVLGDQASIVAFNPQNNEALLPEYKGVTPHIVDQACSIAWSAFRVYRNVSFEKRAQFLEVIATEIVALGDQLIERAISETGLTRMRLEGERERTCGQLRMFAKVVRDGRYVDERIASALPDRKPFPRAELRYSRIALGPVAVFGASNFPLAFSVAGGDTAAALAAGCPVVVKAHSAHPGTSELIGRAVQTAAQQCNMPEGVFSLLFGVGNEIGTALVAHPSIRAVGFTGSRKGGVALMTVAQARPQPIPVYAEMSSINPVYLLQGALSERAKQIAETFVMAQQIGAGQFCTSPGLILALEGPGLDQFLKEASSLIAETESQTMLTEGIHKAYENGVSLLENHTSVSTLARSKPGVGSNQCRAGLYVTNADDFLNYKELAEEVFGACTLVLRCTDINEMLMVTEALEGQLTAAIHSAPSDQELASILVKELEMKVGRVLFNGFGTGVEVCSAMVHGGPFPATSDSRSTSVGSAAIERFIRPVCYQDVPEEILVEILINTNSFALQENISD